MGARAAIRRLTALLAVLLIGLSGILARLTILQVRQAEAYRSLALAQRLARIPLPATRGAILDRDGDELALSLPARAIYADPRAVDDRRGTAARIAEVLGVPAWQIRRKLSEDTTFVYLARQVDPGLAERVAALELPGIGFLEESKRHYPAGPLAAQVLGFVGVDGEGLEGLELQHDPVLAGRDGERAVEMDPGGRPIPQGMHGGRGAVPGSDVVTTIDRDVQFRVQEALEAAVLRNRARGGTVIVMVPRSGEILAMATYPWFDPNRFRQAPPSAVRNRAVTDVYEPGSVNKVITAAAALEEGIVSLREEFMVPDHLRIADKVFHDAHRHPRLRMTLADIIAESSNVGMIMVAQRLGEERLAQYLARFGFGQRTEVGFPGEAEGIVPPLYAWSGTSVGTIPIGQGIAVTALQMAAVYATIANGGLWVQPRLVRGTVDPEGRFHPAPPGERRRVISEETAEAVTGMLAYAVEAGTGAEAQAPGYWVAGKTGTARKPFRHRAGYSDRFIASFIGFLPAADPQVLIAAILDEPVTVYGGVAAAPLFQEIAEYTIARLRIPPAERLPLPPHASPQP